MQFLKKVVPDVHSIIPGLCQVLFCTTTSRNLETVKGEGSPWCLKNLQFDIDTDFRQSWLHRSCKIHKFSIINTEFEPNFSISFFDVHRVKFSFYQYAFFNVFRPPTFLLLFLHLLLSRYHHDSKIEKRHVDKNNNQPKIKLN